MKLHQTQRQQQVGWLLVVLLGSALVGTTLAAAHEAAASAAAAAAQEGRKFLAKPNDPKKQQLIHNEEQKHQQNLKAGTKQQDQGFEWSDLLSIALNLFLGGPINGGPNASDKMDTITQLTNGEFSWTKLLSLGLQLILSAFGGNDNAAIDKMDSGSPLESVLSAVLSYLTGNDNPGEMAVMAKQASELINLVVSLMDTLRTSLSQRSLEARALGGSDPMTEAALATTSMVKTFVRTYGTEDDLCMQKYLCEANAECVKDASDSGYLFCQIGTYGMCYLLERTTYTPFEIFNDAGRRGRLGENCVEIYNECNDI